MTGGIYKITNIINGKFYIGSSSNIYRRWREHKSVAFNEAYKDRPCWEYPLYRAFRKHGLENFKFEIIEKCKTEITIEREKYYYETLEPNYNQMEPMEGCNFRRKQTQETRNKIKEHNAKYWQGKKLPDYMIENIIKGNEAKRKSVKMLDKDTLKVIKEFKSVKDALIYLNKNPNDTGNIKRCCDNPYYKRGELGKVRRATSYGYAWEY